MAARRPNREAGLYGVNISCGVQELRGVSVYEPSVLIRRQIAPSRLNRLAHIVFSDSTRYNRPWTNCSGSSFAQFIRDRNLGRVVRSTERRNPNSGNVIAVWIWTPNKVAVRRFLAGR